MSIIEDQESLFKFDWWRGWYITLYRNCNDM